MGWLRDIFSKKTGGLIKDLGDTVGQFIHTGEEKAAFELKMREMELEFEKLALEAEYKIFEDRAAARKMYATNSTLQEIYALSFLVGYFIIVILLLFLIMNDLTQWTEITLPTWVITLIGTIFGTMSSKVNTIIDFFFGGSSGQRSQSDEIIHSLEQRREAQGGANGT
jgi:hypothetical protein